MNILTEVRKMIYPVITPKTLKLPLYVTGIGIKDFTEQINRPNGYKDNQISIISQGEGVFVCGGKKYILTKGSCFYFAQDIPHQYYSTSKDFEHRWICFNGISIDGLKDLIDKNGYCCLDLKNCDSLKSSFDRLYNLIKRNEEFVQEEASVLLYELIIEYIRLKNSNTSLKSEKNKIQSLLDFIEMNYNKNISLEQLADNFNMSKFTMCRIFKETYGITIFSYLIKYRLQKAKSLLIDNANMSIKEIALSVGFNDVSYFIATFKKHEKITPLEFRKIWV